MAKVRGLREPDDSDDSISLTSSLSSEKVDDYEVECVLAERRKSNGVVEYLTAWKNYAETAHSWEPRQNFNNVDTLNDWKTTKMQIAKGLKKPFDVKAWEKRYRKIMKETRLRKERRRVKRLRLLMQDEKASALGRREADMEGSNPGPTPKPSNKRIKRRSVHQDLPPSSSASASSSSSTEDSDRPLISRQESGISTPKWTQAETITLEKGLRILKGPRWKEILNLYGPGGTINQVLKEKTRSDLYDKAKSVHQEFVDSGREPPEYLKPFSKTTSSEVSRTATPKRGPDSRSESRAVSKKSSRSTSTDLMKAELHEKQQIREAKNQDNGRPQPKTTLIATLKIPRGREKESPPAQKNLGDELQAAQVSEAPARKEEVFFADETLKQATQTTVKPQPPNEAPHPQPKDTVEATENSNDYAHQKIESEGDPRVKEPSQMKTIAQSRRDPESQVPGEKDLATSTAAAALTVPESDETMRGEKARSTWSGTARAQTDRPLAADVSRRGSAGNGLTRQSPSKVKTKIGQIEPKKPSTTGDVTARWNAEPKKQRSNSWATQNAEPVEDQSTKRSFKLLSVQNRVFKSRREGRAPDPSSLVLIDPKTGKAPKTAPAPSVTTMLSQTPLQLHQEEIATKEPQEEQAQKGHDNLVVSTSEPDPPPQTIDQNDDAMINELTPSQTKNLLSNASTSALRPTTSNMAEGPPDIGALTSPPPAPFPRGLPLNTPRGPRAETKKGVATSLQELAQRSEPPTHHLNEAPAKSHPSRSSDETLTFSLRAHPTSQQRDQLFYKVEDNLVIGDIKLAKDDHESIKVRLVGFDFEVHRLLLTIKIIPQTVNFIFDTVCLASEYKAYFSAESSDYLGSGSVLAFRHSASSLENITEALANNLQGGLFFAEKYIMLIYPAGASAWSFLDKSLPSVHPGTVLRFLLRRPLPQVLTNIHGVATTELINKDPERYQELATKIKNHPVQAGDKNINIVFRDMFEIEFDRLVAQNGPQQHPPTNIFFLCFIPQGCENYEPDPAKRSALRMKTSEEHDLFIKFLRANGAEEIYSMQHIGSQEIDNNGSWDYFCKNVKSGTIIFHDAFVRYDLFPRLGKHLLHGSVNVWKTSLSPMHGEKHPHLVRLFPHGGVLLLTESLILYQPREALRILMWFRRVHIPAKAPGTWKLAVRPRVREWLLDIIEAYTDSGKDIFGCSKQIFGDIYTQIYELLQNPDPSEDRLMCHEWDYEVPTDEAPIVSSSSLRALKARKEWKGEGADKEPDDDHIRQNDDLLAQWFAEWAAVNLHNFRKFHVILGYAKDHPFTATAISAYQKGWGHIEVMTSEEACLRHKVAPHSKLDATEAERRRKQKEQLPAKKAANARARKDARDAAKRALALRMQIFRDAGASADQVLSAGRRLLSELGASEKEIEECEVDVERVVVERWWEEDKVKTAAVVDTDCMDTTGL